MHFRRFFFGVSRKPRSPLDGGPTFSLSNRITRGIWKITWFFFASWTPPIMHPWRRFLLNIFGAKVTRPADVRGTANVWLPSNLELRAGALIAEHVICYNQEKITIGEGALVSQGAYLCAGTHDIDSKDFRFVAEQIFIGSNAWIASQAFVGPGVYVGENAVLGARAVTFKSLDPSMVYVGNPAKFLRMRASNDAEK